MTCSSARVRRLLSRIGFCRRSVWSLVVAGSIAFSAQAPGVGLAQVQDTPPWVLKAANTPVHDRWMADKAGQIGTLRLGEVILPSAHDAGTYAFTNGMANGNRPPVYATNQDIDVYTQLQYGVRVLDVRGRKISGRWQKWVGLTPAIGNASRAEDLPEDYYMFHGDVTSDEPLQVALNDVARWVQDPAHTKEVVIVQVSTDSPGGASPRLADLCSSFKQQIGDVLLTPKVFTDLMQAAAARREQAIANNANLFAPQVPVPPLPNLPNLGLDISRYTLDEVWSLPGHQRVILKWDGCVEEWPPHTLTNTYWANQCYAKDYSTVAFDRPGIVNALQDALNGRLSWLDADGIDEGRGRIPRRPSTMPETRPKVYVYADGGTLAPGMYWIGYSWLSPAGETRVSRRTQVPVTTPSATAHIEVELPLLPPGATGAAIYMTQDLSRVAIAVTNDETKLLGVPDAYLTKQAEIKGTNKYTLKAPPTGTGQKPTASGQIGFARDQWGATVPVGFYTLGMSASITVDCLLPMDWFLPQQTIALDTVKDWFDHNQNHARNYLNIISADFVERANLMDYVLQMNTRVAD